MILRELMERVYWDSSEPTDMAPYTTPGDETTFSMATPGALKLIRQINTAQVRVANWKFRDGRILRPRGLRSRMYFNVLTPPSGTATAATATTLTIPELTLDVTGEFNGWLVKLTGGTGEGQIRLVTASLYATPSVVLAVDSAWDTTPDATTTYELYKSFFEFFMQITSAYQQHHIVLSPTAGLADVMRIRDVTSNTDLARIYNNDMLTGSLKSVGIPSAFMVYGNQIWFDAAPDEVRAYEMLYIRHPGAMALEGDVPELPEPYHEAIGLWATHNVMRTHQDFNGAYATKRELEDLMQGLRLAGEFEMELENGGVTVYG